MRRGILVAIGIAVGVLALWWSRRADPGHESPAAVRAPEAGGGAAGAEAPASADRAESRAAPDKSTGTRRHARSEAAAARDRLIRDIARARERRLARSATPSQPPAAEQPTEQRVGKLDKEYIRDRVKEIVPLLAECYENALADEPGLSGTVVVDFVMAGEPEVGGVVESSEIDAERSTLSRPGLDECISETMYALEFDPPEDGGQVEVRYPFKFRSEPE